MLRIYFSIMLLLVTVGVVCTVSATSALGLGAGLVLLTVGAGGVSAGVMTRDTKQAARRQFREDQVEPVMKKRIPHKHLPGKNSHKGPVAKTGEHCPVTGWWALRARNGDSRFITEGSIMPADKGATVTWTLVPDESGSPKPKHAHPVVGASLDSY